MTLIVIGLIATNLNTEALNASALIAMPDGASMSLGVFKIFCPLAS